MPRRGTNVYKRKDGRWEGRVNKPGSGKTKYVSVYGKSYQEVREKTEKLRLEIKKGEVSPFDSMTMREAADIWIKDKSAYWKASTYSAYQNMLRKYILPYLGDDIVIRVNNQVVEEFLAKIRQRDNGVLLSNNYLHSICGVLTMMLTHIRKKYNGTFSVPNNPVLLSRPRQLILPSENSLKILVNYLVTHIEDDTCLGILIAYYTGIRIGELCALTWGDIDLKEEIISINKNIQRVTSRSEKNSGTEILLQNPKTSTSLRNIPLPPVLLKYLKEYHCEKGYVIKGKKNPWAEPRTLQYRFSRILQECKLQPFHFHMLRHCFATRCIDKGFDVKSLSEILGHSNVQITLNLYVHSSMLRKKQLMNLFVYLPGEEAKENKINF